MKNTKIIVTTVLVSVLGFSSFNSVSASDFDCTTLNKESMKELMTKVRYGDTLTSSEEELLENAKECKPEGGKNMQRPGNQEGGKGMKDEKTELTDDQLANRANIKSIIEKQENGETLTDDEQDKYDEYLENQENRGENKKTRTVKNLSEKSKISLTSSIDKISESYTDLSDEEKIVKYEKIQEKLETILEKIESSTSYNETKIKLYTSIINELLNQLDTKIEELN